jgi:hypothetical protein
VTAPSAPTPGDSSRGQGSSGGGSTAQPGTPTLPSDDDDSRRVAHELLSQTHALMFAAFQEGNIQAWCPPELTDSVRNSAPRLWLAFGQAQTEVASGEHDGPIAESGLSQELAVPKRRGLAGAVESAIRAFRTQTRQHPILRRRLQNAITWARGAIGSMSFIPGVEIIGEALDVTNAALGQTEISDT